MCFFPHFRPLKCRSYRFPVIFWGQNHTPGRSRGVRKVVCAGAGFCWVPRGGDLIEESSNLLLDMKKTMCKVVGFWLELQIYMNKNNLLSMINLTSRMSNMKLAGFKRIKTALLGNFPPTPCQSRADYEYVLSIRHLDQTWLNTEEEQRCKR